MDSLSGSIERITYYNAENGYSVIRMRPPKRNLPGANREGLVTIVGNLPELSPGEHVKLKGNWVKHAQHGTQFQVEKCEQTLPATITGIQRYLGSGLIRGIGARLAERIVDHFGESTLDIIEQQPERLLDVPDIGPKRSHQIAAAWQEQKQVKEIMLFLHSHGISTNLAVKIYKTYGDLALATVQENPYQLARDIYGVGFKTADRIAQDLGLPPDHPARIEAGVIYALNDMSNDGHVYAPQALLAERAVELLSTDPDLIQPALDRLSKEDRIRSDVLPTEITGALETTSQGVAEPGADYRVPAIAPAIYLTPFYFGEVGVAERLRALAEASSTYQKSNQHPLPDPDLSAEQQQAVLNAMTNPVSVLTGGPGTGKTTCLKSLIANLESLGISYALASPTGRAAKRLSEATGQPASTIHRLLGFSPREGFKHHPENPLPIDFLVIDEVSMLDLLLANNLLKALKPGAHLLLVGDVDQLPSVGAGDVLRDIIASGTAPVTRLNTIFRQAAGSMIITNAHRINGGEMPFFPKSKSKQEDFYLFSAEDAGGAADWVEEVVCQRIPETFGFDARRQIQVLAPMYRGPAGVTLLNQRLQEALNPASPRKAEKALYGQTFRPGDKVMQTQNDYDKKVYNGDIGYVKALDMVEHALHIDFEGRLIEYDWSEADQLMLAYAVTVHKAQGSEFPVVVMPIVTGHYIMLQRNLLYTAITRARNLCVLVGNRRAISIAVHNNKVAQRYSALDWRLGRHAR
jgi:exodeoxyribonuclease V alpha subunit